MSRSFSQLAVGGPWGWHSISLQPMWDSCVSLSWTTHIRTTPKGWWWGQDRLPRLGTPSYILPVAEPLPSPYCTWHHAIRPYGAPAHHVSCGAASSSHSCLCICSRVAQAASFSFSQAANLIRTSPNVNLGEGIMVLWGGLEVASE